MTNCTQCPHHAIISDPDPKDWFCDDDVAVICTLKKQRPKQSAYAVDRQAFKPVAISCRPYNARKEAITPKWCPLEKKVKR
jgi:hypothetical protein